MSEAEALIAQLEARLSKWKLNSDKARLSVPLGELRTLLDSYRTAERERDEARGQRDYWRGRDKAGLEIEAELIADITRGIEQEQHLTTKLGIATRRAEAAESALSARSREVERLRSALKPFGEYMVGGMDLDNMGSPLPDSQGVGWIYLTHADFRRARQALEAPHE